MPEESKAIRVVIFDNKNKNYRTWAKKFMTAAMLRRYNVVLLETNPKVPRQSKVLKDMEKDSLKLRKANQRACCKLILACHRDKALG